MGTNPFLLHVSSLFLNPKVQFLRQLSHQRYEFVLKLLQRLIDFPSLVDCMLLVIFDLPTHN
jgi:hypothetical protein